MTVAREPSMQAIAYQHIRQKIASCEYAPKQMLSESQLQKELNCSRTPVREAVSRLAQEGLLQVFPKRGIMVSSITVRDIHQIFEVRSLVEPYNLRMYHDNLDLDKIKQYSEIFHSYGGADNKQDFYALDDAFHTMLLSAMQNDHLRMLNDRIRTQNMRLRVMSGQNIEHRIRRTMEEHAQITDNCLARKWEEAARVMEEHLEHSRESSLEAILQCSVPDAF